ncbi:MAG: beta-ketoacyl synthase N-terminal-like domain-containing protein [Tepidisphaeraceae bacterium]
MNRIPVITGVGLVTPLGSDVGETWRALMDGQHIMAHSRCPLEPTSPDRVNRLATVAAGEAIADAGWTESRPVFGPVNPPTRGRADSLSSRTALVAATSKGAVDAWMTAPPEISFLASTAVAVRERFPFLDGPSLTLSAACASGLHALIRAAMMIQSGEADRVLVVAAEASVHPLFLASFQRLGVLPREGVGCRPFDEDRGGFLMSESAAAVCLESAEVSPRRSKGPQVRRPGYARIDRFALGGDATHMTGGDPGGETLRRLLRSVAAARAVDLIHAHGTGTTFNDPIELAAFEDELGAQNGANRPTVYSHKGALGHSLGAAGLVAIVLNCLMHRKSIVPPNIQTRRALVTRRVALSREAAERPIARSVTVGSGFGGPMAVVALISP